MALEDAKTSLPSSQSVNIVLHVNLANLVLAGLFVFWGTEKWVKFSLLVTSVGRESSVKASLASSFKD